MGGVDRFFARLKSRMPRALLRARETQSCFDAAICLDETSSTVKIAPHKIRLEASSFCQLRCPSCPTAAGFIDPVVRAGFLRLGDFQRFVDRNPRIEEIELSNYGEVFLNPELLQILDYAHAKNVRLEIRNGANLNHVRKEVLEGLVKYKVAAMTCSLDGASQETYKVYRVRGDFDQVIRNIQLINEYKARHGTDLPRLAWQFVVFGHNEHEIPLAREMAARLGMQFLTKLTWDDSFSPIRDKAFVRMQIGAQATTRAEFESEHGKDYVSGICNQLWDEPQINWNGDNLGCCRNFWGDFGGNAFRDGLDATINSEKMIYAREMLTGRAPPRSDIPCATCEMYKARCERSCFVDRQ